MKLNYREKVILGVLLALIICVAGYIGLIRTKSEQIKADKVTLEQKEADKAEVDGKIAQIVPLTNEINDTYTETKKLTADFVSYDKILNSNDVDQFMQKYADENEVKIYTLNVAGLNAGPIDYYFFTPEFPGEKMLEASDLNGGIMAGVNKDKAESAALTERTVEEALVANYDIVVRGKKEAVWNFMKALEEQDETVIINSVAIDDFTFGVTEDENGNEIPPADGMDESNVTFNVSLYSVYEMAKPNTDAE
jgi:hypothetical protein